MKEFLSTYLEMLQNNHDMVGQVHSDFKRQFVDMSVDKLLEQFVLNKYTGLEKPGKYRSFGLVFPVFNSQFNLPEMPELEYVALSSGSRLQQPQTSATASNSNSATSIQAAIRAGGNATTNVSGSVVSMDQRGDALGGISLGSGSAASGSIPYTEDPILGGALGSPRPTSPEPAGSGPTSTVKSLRSWFLPTAKQQPQPSTTGASNFGMSGGSTTTTTATATAGNSSNNSNTNNTPTTTTATTTGTNNLTTNIITKNSPNSEDTSNQGSFSFFFSLYFLLVLFYVGWDPTVIVSPLYITCLPLPDSIVHLYIFLICS